MSVPVTSQAMPGPSPQLSQDVAGPPPLQVGGQQALQGQPPLQHVPSHQPQTVAQSHGTGSGSGPPQAKRVRKSVVSSHGTGSSNALPWANRGHHKSSMSQLHDVGSDSVPAQAKRRQYKSHKKRRCYKSSSSQYLSSNPPPNPPTSPPSQPQAEAAQPPSSSQPSSSQLMSVPVTSQPMPGPSPQLSQDVAAPHPLQVGGQQALQGQPPLQHVPSHQPQTVAQSHGTGSGSGPPQAKGTRYALPMAQSHGNGSSSVPLQAIGKCTSLVAQSHNTSSDSDLPRAKKKCYEPPVAQSCDTGPDRDAPQAKSKRKSPMTQFIEYVKTLYRQSAVEKKLNTIKWPPTPSTVYINLVCVDRTTHVSKEEADECTRAMVCDGSVDVVLGKKTPIDFSDIAEDVPLLERKVILVEGAPGVGKSTLAWEFCRKWERGEIAQQYSLVLLIRLRDQIIRKAQSVSDLLHHPSKAVVQAVEDELIATLGANTLIILEGFDELPSTCRRESSVFLRLINGELPHATVLVTSRPWATQDLHWQCSHRIFQHIEILGFTGKQIEEYVKSIFTGEGKPANDKDTEEVMSYIKRYPQIKASMYIPLNLAIVVSVYQESKAGKCILPKTLTELYSALTQTILVRYLYGHPEYGQRRWKIQSLKKDLPPDVYSKLLAISELAYSGIATDQEGSVQLIFTNLPPDFETLGLTQSVPQLYVTQGEDMSHNFLHLTVQEFLAALHISNMSPEKQLEHFQRQKKEWWEEEGEEGRWRVVLRFLAGLTKLDNLSPEDLRDLLHELKKPNEDHITACRWDVYSATPNVGLSGELVNLMFETQRDDIVPLVLQERIVDFICEVGLTLLDYYSLGYCIVHSHSQWVLTVQGSEIEEEEVRMLVAGASTRDDTSARVVELRGEERIEECGGGHWPLSVSAESLLTLSTELENVIRLQELHLKLPAECSSSITWPDLSGLRVLHLAFSDERNWRLDTLLPHLSLESLTIEPSDEVDKVVFEHCVAIGMLLSSSNCLKCLHFQSYESLLDIDPKGMEAITKAMSENEHLPLRSVVMKCKCTFSDTPAHSLAVFIRKTTTLYHLCIGWCTFSAHGLLELARAIHDSSSLQEGWLKYLTCTVDGDDEVTYCAQLLHHYPHMVDRIQWSHISDRGVEVIANALHHNSTLRRLDLSNSRISNAGSTALAQALHHNSTLRRLDLSNSRISNAGSMALAQALHHNSTLGKLDLSNSRISNAGSMALAQALHHNSTLRWLYLSNSRISDAGFAALAQALHHNSTLVVLDLSNNNITDTGSAALAQALHHNSTLEGLHLSGNDVMSAEDTRQLVQALTVNPSVHLTLPRRCEEYATQCPQYSQVKRKIRFC